MKFWDSKNKKLGDQKSNIGSGARLHIETFDLISQYFAH